LLSPLPAAPKSLFGREREQTDIFNLLTSETEARIAILGFGGMGKTALALSVLHSPMAVQRFQQRLFIPCDEIATTEDLISSLADMLGIPATNRDSLLRNRVVQTLGNKTPTLLCLDNFETVWDSPRDRHHADTLLRLLDGVPQLSILLTMRGSQRPSSVVWSKPLLGPLGELSMQDTQQIVNEIADVESDEHTDMLLNAMGGIPLAATLFASLIRDALETSATLWNRWQYERTSILETGGLDRHSSLDVSIHISINSPRMRACPSAIDVLSLLAFLPAGFPESLIPDLSFELSSIGLNTDGAIQTLKRASLITLDHSMETPRLRLLPPIRHYCIRHHQPRPHAFSALANVYTQFIIKNADFSSARSHALVSIELSNLRLVFMNLLKEGYPSQKLIRSIAIHTEWCHYLGHYSDDLVKFAIDQSQMWPEETADCLYSAGKMYESCNRLHEAQSAFERAISYYQEAGDVGGEARGLRWLGRLEMRSDRFDSAKVSFMRAVELHASVGDVQGEADDLQQMGDLQIRTNDQDARKSLTRAMYLHRKTKDVLGEANDHASLGQLQMRMGNFDTAARRFNSALRLHTKVSDTYGAANDLRNLGAFYIEKKTWYSAEHALKQAFDLHQQINDIRGQGYDMRDLGQVYARRGELLAAEEALRQAISLHVKAMDKSGEAGDLQDLGDFYRRNGQSARAIHLFSRALTLHRELDDKSGEAYDIKRLVELGVGHSIPSRDLHNNHPYSA
jgi:tetratricopeptide (TPR) repeat protein